MIPLEFEMSCEDEDGDHGDGKFGGGDFLDDDHDDAKDGDRQPSTFDWTAELRKIKSIVDSITEKMNMLSREKHELELQTRQHLNQQEKLKGEIEGFKKKLETQTKLNQLYRKKISKIECEMKEVTRKDDTS